MTVRISILRVMAALVAAAVILALGEVLSLYMKWGAGGNAYPELTQLLNLRDDGNLPTWYSATLHLLCALILGAIAQGNVNGERREKAIWLMLAGIFLFLSIDETAMLHERLTEFLQQRYDFPALLTFTWIVPAFAALIAIAMLCREFLLRLPSGTRGLFVAAGSLYVAAVLGLEMVAGTYKFHYGFDNRAFDLIITAKKLAQFSALLLFIYALLIYVHVQSASVQLRLSSRSAGRTKLPVGSGEPASSYVGE